MTRLRRCSTRRTSRRTRRSASRRTRWTGRSRPSWCRRCSRLSVPARLTLASWMPSVRTGSLAVPSVSVAALVCGRARGGELRDRDGGRGGDLQHSQGPLPTIVRRLR